MKTTDEDQVKDRLKNKIELYQSLLNFFRDITIFCTFILFLFQPKLINGILTRAGFVEGEVELFGLKLKNQFEETDKKLLNATEQIDNLKKNLDESNNIISQLKDENEVKDEGITNQINANEEAVQEASEINSEIQTTLEKNTPLLNPRVDAELTSLVRIVNDYKIQIFYNPNKLNQKVVAFDIKEALTTVGITSTNIEVKPNHQYDKASSNQIRYFAKNEREVAFALQNVLNRTYSKRSFNLQTVYTPSPGSVSIFLKT